MNNSDTIDYFATSFEPVFYFGIKNSGLIKKNHIPDTLIQGRLDNYFEFSIKQNPKDLSRHLQRINVALLNTDNSSELFAALCDLFIILGTLGTSLRQRLFKLSKNKLEAEQIELLISHMKDGQLSTDSSRLPTNCFLKEQTIDLIKPVAFKKAESQQAEDILSTADSYVENSQFDTAINYMTQHLEKDHDNEALTIKLISLYKGLSYEHKFQTAYKQFSNNFLTSRYWDDARQYFLDKQS